MKRITPATESRLMHVIEKTAELVNSGSTPNDAIIKIARAESIRPSEIQLVVHAYNTGRTSRQRQDGEDLFEKAAEFALADANVILEAMYPTNVKTAAVKARETVVSAEYSYSPADLLARRQAQEKRASNINWREMNGQTITAPPALPVDQHHLQKVALAKITRAHDKASEARRKMASAFDQIGTAFNDLTTYFRRPDATPMPVVKEAVILMHGGVGKQLFDQLVAVTPGLAKMASRKPTEASDLDCNQAPFPLVADVLQKAAAYVAASKDFEAATLTYEKEAGEAARPFVRAVSTSILPEEPSSEGLRDKAAEGYGLGDSVKMLGAYNIAERALGPMVDKMKGPDDETRLNKAVSQLNDPNHELRLREINTQAMLQDLSLSDPVISGYDSHEIADAFNNINQISPSVADQRSIMQSLLRKHLQQGQLDSFEHDQLLGFEEKLRRQNQPAGGASRGSII